MNTSGMSGSRSQTGNSAFDQQLVFYIAGKGFRLTSEGKEGEKEGSSVFLPYTQAVYVKGGLRAFVVQQAGSTSERVVVRKIRGFGRLDLGLGGWVRRLGCEIRGGNWAWKLGLVVLDWLDLGLVILDGSDLGLVVLDRLFVDIIPFHLIFVRHSFN